MVDWHQNVVQQHPLLIIPGILFICPIKELLIFLSAVRSAYADIRCKNTCWWIEALIHILKQHVNLVFSYLKGVTLGVSNHFLLSWLTGHVGAPLPCNLIKLVDVPEKNYFASKGEGEVSSII